MRTLIWYFKEILALGYHWEKQANQLSQKCLGYETDLSAEILGSPKLEASMAVLRACLTSPLQVSAWNMLSAQANESVVLGTIVDRKVPFHREIFLLMHLPSRIATDWSSHMTHCICLRPAHISSQSFWLAQGTTLLPIRMRCPGFWGAL